MGIAIYYKKRLNVYDNYNTDLKLLKLNTITMKVSNITPALINIQKKLAAN